MNWRIFQKVETASTNRDAREGAYETTLRHAIVRLSDNQLLATAETTWKG